MKRDMITDEILVDYLLGEASKEDKLRVESWIKESPANKDYFETFRHAWNASSLMASPATTEDDAWRNMQQRLHSGRRERQVIPLGNSYTRYIRVAAIVLLFIGFGAVAYVMNNDEAQPAIAKSQELPEQVVPAKQQVVAVAEEPIHTPVQEKPGAEETSIRKEEPIVKAPIANEKPAKKAASYDLAKLADDCKTKGEICNGTPCPLEICIIQKSTCDKDHPYPISNCSILEPDKTGQLTYKGYDEKVYNNCVHHVEEIRITRMTTGETIVLDAQSPVTAQEFFSYLTGKKEGEITAGIFRADCNNDYREHDLNMDNTLGGIHFR